YVDPSEDLILEGPFGDHTGFYSLADYFPRFHVTCITHRRDAIYPATIVGVPPQEDAWIGKATERIFLFPIRMTVVPELTDMHMPMEGVFHNIALTAIHEQFPGQAPKVMNALWGAGQMMFNKVMVVADSNVDLHDYVTLAKVISEKVDPLGDLHFSRGPVDILDHSSPVYAYGSKIGLDATSKSDPIQIASDPVADKPSIDKAALKSEFPEITGIRDDFLEAGISLVICSVRKSRKNHLRQIAERMIQNNRIQHVKFVVLTDDQVDLTNLHQLTWLVANNIDPLRDCFVLDRNPGEKFPTLWIDGTSKDPELDGFSREWPNIVAMDPQTIRSVDEKWNSLKLGPLIPSPSAMLQTLVNSPGAISKRP
ncbi:MAG TPA: UbiD family decarboxylase, partial [Bacteroidales bacterium]|nr:UbiD family decarboxylase [Bacteroidales bacterium]